MAKRMDPREYFASSLKELSLKKPVDKISISEIAEAAGYSRKNFYYYFEDRNDLISWYFNHEGKQLMRDNSDRDWSYILIRYLQDIRTYQAYYLYIFADDGPSPLIKGFFEYIISTMKEYAEINGHTLSEDDLFYLEYIAYGNTRMTKSWLEDGCRKTEETFAAKLVSAYPESMKVIFR